MCLCGSDWKHGHRNHKLAWGKLDLVDENNLHVYLRRKEITLKTPAQRQEEGDTVEVECEPAFLQF